MLRLLSNLLIGLLCLCGTAISAQQYAAPDKVDIFMEFTGRDVHFNPLVDSLATYAHDTISITVLVILPVDQTSANINVVAGITEGGSQLISKSFAYNSDAIMPDGTTYRREGKNLYLGLGKFFGISKVYAAVQLDYGGGNLSSSVSTNTN